MPGQGVITIDGKQWTVSIATTIAELAAGLSGIASMPAGTGILFDLGSDRSSISVNMSEMLFALDIVFINSTAGVVGVLHDVRPGEDAQFQAGVGAGARYFLEVNTGEAEDIAVGDSVDLGQPEQGIIQPAFWVTFLNVITAVIIGIGAYKELRGTKEPKEPRVPRENRR